MTRTEHLQWSKERAVEISDTGDAMGAWTSFMSDMSKHSETRDHVALEIGTMQIFGGLLLNAGDVRRFIEDFN